MALFEDCHAVNDALLDGEEQIARERLIRLLAGLKEKGTSYTPIVNALIRQVGLFPYIEYASASWSDRFVYEAFKTEIGGGESVTLHRKQSKLLQALLDGRDIAVSAPTSFGKSFVIDAFIAIRQPSTVLIVVPTIALADETRRRLQRKFGREYKIITTTGQQLAEKTILVFPAERAVRYVKQIETLDILIVDEFYKASREFDPQRSSALIRAIVAFSAVASQRYFLAPNIDGLDANEFTKGMEFFRVEFSTVVLETTNLSPETGGNSQKKSEALLTILDESPGKTLIYAGGYANITRIANLLMTNLENSKKDLLTDFCNWLAVNYDPNWTLPRLIEKGVGIHNGRLHRSLTQIQVKLFEENDGLDSIISTSSIIEGVNTSAKTVVLWSNRNGTPKITDFTYKNIIGRGGRMLKHFVGNIFVLEEPPVASENQLRLEYPDELLGLIDEQSLSVEFTSEQLAAIAKYKEELQHLVGEQKSIGLRDADALVTNDTEFVLRITGELLDNPKAWNGLANLNSEDPQRWDRLLYKLIRLQPSGWGTGYTKFVSFVSILSGNWTTSLPQLFSRLEAVDIDIDLFFELERNVTFKLASLLGDVQTIYNEINDSEQVDLSVALSRFSHAFLPPLVYQLEEYGLPRMISQKIHRAGVADLESMSLELCDLLESLRSIGVDECIAAVPTLDTFDQYIVRYFYDGIGCT